MKKATLRISTEGNDVKDNKDPYKFSLYADDDHVLIKEAARGSGTVAYHESATIAHNLGYIPFYAVYCQTAANTYAIANSFDPVGSGWRVYADTTNLYIVNNFDVGGDGYTGYQYFIFYDNMS